MEGIPEPAELKGIIPRAFSEIFEQVVMQGKENVEFLVRASYLEIYNEEIRRARGPAIASDVVMCAG